MDATPPAPSERTRRRGRWAVRDAAYTSVQQARGALLRARPESLLTGTARPVLMLPGVYEDWRFMRPLIELVHARGHPVHVVPSLGHNFGHIPRATRAVRDHLAQHGLTEVVIVAHSKGGLIGKYAMIQPGSAERIDRMVAICTPFSGSDYARLAPVRHLRDFSPDDAVGGYLARHEEVNARIISIFGRWDPLIPQGSELPGARNVRLDSGGHFRLILHRDTVRIVLEAVR